MNPIEVPNKTKIAIIASDVSSNSLGRAYMLADALSSQYAVTLIGPAYQENNYSIWEPVKNSKIPVQLFHANNSLKLYDQLKLVASKIDAHLVIACKPRMPSFYLGLLIRSQNNAPLILDIDDYELSFFSDHSKNLRNSDLLRPKGKAWSILAELLIQHADQILVSNIALQKKYGGTVIPHARNETTFDPALYNKMARRKELGIAETDKIALFMGTPREHKGLVKLSQAIKDCKDKTYKLCIIGSFPDNTLREELQAIAGDRLILMPNQPFQDTAKNVAIADLVCLVQHAENETAKYQLPAKAIDAIAMGIPVLATETEPIMPLIEQGLIVPTSEQTLAEDLEQALKNAEELHQKQLANRPIFIANYSYKAILNELEKVITSSPINLMPLPDSTFTFIDTFRTIVHEKKDLSDQTKKQAQTIKQQERKIEKLRNSLRTIEESNSWKLTFPLRRLSELINKPAQKKH